MPGAINRRRRSLRPLSLVVTSLLIITGMITLAFNEKKNELGKSVKHNWQPANKLALLAKADTWVNSVPLDPKALRGKIVLVNFWTYTCINWRRQLPYIRAWASKYKSYGLEVIGVHTPEFSFEEKIINVRWAVEEMDIDYAIAIDNNYSIWNGFNNHYWPALYFFDGRGKLRHTQFGEGEYEESERVIQQLLEESGSTTFNNDLVSVNPLRYELGPDWNNLKSPENYLGYDRANDFVSDNGKKSGKSFSYRAPTVLLLNQWGLGGNWTRGRQFITLNESNGRILYRFQARDLHVVMSPTKPGVSLKFKVLINGQPPGEAHGTDIDSEGNGIIIEQRMYHLIRQPGPVKDLLFEIGFSEPGVEVFVFTFG